MKLLPCSSLLLVGVVFLSSLLHTNSLPSHWSSGHHVSRKTSLRLFDVPPTKSNRKTQEPTFAPWEETDEPSPSPTEPPTSGPQTDDPTPAPSSPKPTTNPTTYEPTPSPTGESTTTKEPTSSPTEELTTTNEPTPGPSINPTTYEPTSSPTEESEFFSPESPTNSPTNSPTDSPTERPTDPPSDNPTSPSPSTNPSAAPTEGPFKSPSIAPVVATSSPTAAPQSEAFKDNLVAEVQDLANTIEFVVALSLWSPQGVPREEVDFEPIRDAVLTSIRMLYCEDPFVAVCVVRDDLLFTSKDTFVAQTKQDAVRRKTLVVPAIGKVTAVEEARFAYTAWEINVEVLQLGSQYVQEILVQLQETNLGTEEMLAIMPQMIQEKVTLDVQQSIQDGTFDGLLHGILLDDEIVSSIPGEEEATFGVLIPQTTLEDPGEPTEKESGPDLALIAIYVAIAVVIIILAACMLVLYYYHRLESGPTSAEDREEKQKALSSASEASIASTLTGGIAPAPAMTSPSVATKSEMEDLSTADASWQVRPRRFVLQTDSQCPSESDHADDATNFPTAGSIVAGSVMVGSMMADSVESSLDGWSLHPTDINWA